MILITYIHGSRRNRTLFDLADKHNVGIHGGRKGEGRKYTLRGSERKPGGEWAMMQEANRLDFVAQVKIEE